VLSPDLPFAAWILVAVFIAVAGTLAFRAQRKDRREYRRFKLFRSTVLRQRMYRKWLRESFLVFGGLSVVLLALVWQYLPLVLADANSWDAVVGMRSAFAQGGWVSIAILAIATALFVVGPIVALYLARGEVTGGDASELASVGDIQALLPRNRAEVRIGALLSINAGVVEEVLFRLALPALLYGAFGNALFALVTSALLFGALHAYQGIAGVLGTVFVGALLTVLYVASGTILVPILVHVLIDLRSFVLIPLIVLRVPAGLAAPGSPVPPAARP
jgi:uncharacterized protein